MEVMFSLIEVKVFPIGLSAVQLLLRTASQLIRVDVCPIIGLPSPPGCDVFYVCPRPCTPIRPFKNRVPFLEIHIRLPDFGLNQNSGKRISTTQDGYALIRESNSRPSTQMGH